MPSTYHEALALLPPELKSQAIQVFKHYEAFERDKVIHPGPLFIIDKWLKETKENSENLSQEELEVLEVIYGLSLLLTMPEYQTQANAYLSKLLDALKTIPEMQKRFEIDQMKVLLS